MNDETKDIQDMSDAERKQIAEAAPTGGNMLMDRQAFAQAYQVARLFSSSQLVPQHLQGKPHDCFIALHMANRLREDPLMVMQNIVIVHGTAGWKATWLIGRANRSGVFRGRIRFSPEGGGDNLAVTASAVLADTGEEVKATVDMKMAKAEGWTKNAKYQSMPEQMLSYRAASFLIRLYCPEATLGYQTAEEVEDMAASGQLRDVTPGRHTPAGGAEAALRGLPDGDDSGAPANGSGAPAGNGEQSEPTGKVKPGTPDHHGTPYDPRIHAASGTTTKDGGWRRRRGISDEYFEEVMAEILGRKGAPEDATAAPQEPQEPTSPEGRGSPGSADNGAQAPAGATQGGDDGFGLAPPGDQAPSGGGPSDAEIVQRIQRTLPAARSNGDLDTIADLESEASEIANEDWREHCRSELQAAREAVETGAT